MKKQAYLIGLFLVLSGFALDLHAQVGINATGAAPKASSMLDVSSNNKGLLIPRVMLSATNNASPITSPDTSLLVYNTATSGSFPNNVIPGYYYWKGSSWVHLLAGGFDLPFVGTGAGTASVKLFDLTNTGVNSAASFAINNAANNSSSLVATTDGTGRAATFSNTNAANTQYVVHASTSGLGNVGRFEISNGSNSSYALEATTNGTGRAATFLNNNAANNGHVLHCLTIGTGPGAEFRINNSVNSSDALISNTNGNGRAAKFDITNATNNANALQSATTGTGRAGFFQINNASNVNETLLASTNGLGGAARVVIGNVSNSVDALVCVTNGSGSAAYFETSGTGVAAELKSTNGTPKALKTTGGVQLTGINEGGTAGSVLTSDDMGNATWRRNIGFYANMSAAQVVTSNTQEKLVFNTEVRDDGNGYNPATQVFTAPSAGLYHFDVCITWTTAFIVNNVAVMLALSDHIASQTTSFTTAEFPHISCSTSVYMDANDTIEARVFQDTGVQKSVSSGLSSFFCGYKVY